MTDRELALIIYSALMSIAKALAKKYGFGEYKALPDTKTATFASNFYVQEGEATENKV